ncbi:hypothetical protein RT97_16755 [Variovorax paradoxus]|uniref:Probable zinc-binding domain-containing protein n=1 Tax=Variovorax paradoxus TaxID=34073 RepID=A0A0D0MFR2_VARPD|nr:zinc-ribbon domain containing protein [Variovorax paradoxus]KIQ31161.1 hypothetical protein RT97_16755 [Variovorax paradoxus]
MKSNKQRRAEIKAHRLERAARAAARQRAHVDGRLVRGAIGQVAADTALLAANNNTYGLLPVYYVDKAFTCRDCDAEQVWTAKQQKWWYESMHGNINSTAVRCLRCRRARRARLHASQAPDGANLLGVQTMRLRALGAAAPNAEAAAELEAALQSKWWSLRTVAIQAMARWGDSERIGRLLALVAARPSGGRRYSTWERVAADTAAHALRETHAT